MDLCVHHGSVLLYRSLAFTAFNPIKVRCALAHKKAIHLTLTPCVHQNDSVIRRAAMPAHFTVSLILDSEVSLDTVYGSLLHSVYGSLFGQCLWRSL